MQKPSFWRLLGAYSIDILILFVLNLGYYMWEVRSTISTLPWMWSISINLAIFLILNAGYFALFEQHGKGSLGKKLFHLKLFMNRSSAKRVFSAYAIECIGLFFLIWGIIFLSTFVWNDMEKMVLWFLSGWVLGPILILIYFSVLESMFGASLGKKLMGLQVVQAAPQKQKEETK